MTDPNQELPPVGNRNSMFATCWQSAKAWWRGDHLRRDDAHDAHDTHDAHDDGDHHAHPAFPLENGPEHPGPGVIYLPDDGRVRIWDKPENVHKLLKCFFVGCGVILALDLLFLFGVKKYSALEKGTGLHIDKWPGFYSFYGLAACVVLVLIAKQMRKILIRDERYYEDRDL